MATDVTTQIIQENPEIEAHRLALLGAVRQFVNDNLLNMPPAPITPPAYQVAGLSPFQQQSAQLAQQGLGSYQPYLQEGLNTLRRGELGVNTYGYGGLQEAFDASRTGQQALYGAGSQYDPSSYQSYMNPYEDEVVQQTLSDIRRQGDIQQQGLDAQAAAAGAFGGSRQAVAQQELNRNVLDQQTRAASQLRQQGYSTAQGQAQQAFEQAKQRQLAQAGQYGALSQGLGSLAGQAGSLGGQLANMGLQQAGLGQLGQQLQGTDIRTLEALGARDQALNQAILDAQRQTNLQLYQMPYQQYGFLSDIYKGTPSSQTTTQINQTQDPSTFQQIAGLGIAGLGAASGAKSLFG